MEQHNKAGNQYGFVPSPHTPGMSSQFSIPGFGTPAPVGNGVGAFVPPPPPPQFQNGQMPTITLEQLNAYAASMPPQFWSQFTSTGPPGISPMANNTIGTQALLADTNELTSTPTPIQSSMPVMQNMDQGAVSSSNDNIQLVRDNTTKSPKSTRNSRRKKRASLLNVASPTSVTETSAQPASMLPKALNMAPARPTGQNSGPNLHQRAIGTVRELFSHGVRFEDLLMRSVGKDEIELLRELYQDAGLPVSNQSSKYLQNSKQHHSTSTPTVTSQLVAGNEPKAKEHIPTAQTAAPSPIPSVPNGKTTQAKPTDAEQKKLPALIAAKRPHQPPNRELYLAKLQAVRNKSNGRTSESPAPAPTLAQASASQTPVSAISNAKNVPDMSRNPNKMSTLNGIPGLSTPIESSSSKSAEPITRTQVQPSILSEPPTNTPVFKNSSNDLTEKVRQRLAALKNKKPTETPLGHRKGSGSFSEQPTPSSFSQSPVGGKPETQDTASSIPGLFMATSPASNSSSTNLLNGVLATSIHVDSSTAITTMDKMLVAAQPTTITRKRPVAADFLDSDVGQSKRPFAPSRQSSAIYPQEPKESCIIDLTEDESSDGEEMDLDQGPEDEFGPTSTQSNSASESSPSYVVRTHSPRANPLSQIQNALPSGTQSPKALVAQRLLVAKERAIREMRDKIKAKSEEQKRKAQSGQQTPNSNKSGQLVSTPINIESSTKVPYESTSIQTVGNVNAQASPSITSSSVKEVVAHAPATINHHLTVAKLTQPQLPAAVPSQRELQRKKHAEIDTGIAQNNSKLEQLQREMQRLMEENQRALEDKQKLATGLELAGVNTKGMSHDDMQNTKDDLEQAQLEEASEEVDGASAATHHQIELSDESISDEEHLAPVVSGTNELDSDVAMDKEPESQEMSAALVQDAIPQGDGTPLVVLLEHELDLAAEATPENAVHDLVSVPIGIPEDSSVDSESENDDMEVTHEELSLTGSMESGEIDEDAMSTDSDNEDGSEGEVDESEPETDGSLFVKDFSAHVRENDVSNDGGAEAAAQEGDSENDELTEALDDVSDDRDANLPLHIVSDDLAPELEIAAERAQSSVQKVAPITNYVPYQSPLQVFKAYRFHPEYLSTVGGGYKSTTYSHNINENVPMCPSELNFGSCSNTECQFQHFKDMQLPDQEMLKEIGAAYPFGDNKTRLDEWKQGLRQVLQTFHAQHTGGQLDSNSVAAALSEFRRQFLGDSSRVLNLGDT